MKSSYTEDIAENMVEMDTASFVKNYNENTPESFPRASKAILEKFQETYPSVFTRKKLWNVIKHRKKVMDWLATYSRITNL